MTWFKIDDSFYDHPKVFDAPDCALALWLRAGTWSARNLTDGLVPPGMPARLCDDPERAVKELLDRGLWKRAKGGYRYHDWHDYQPNKDQVEAERKAARVRMQKLREQRKAAGRAVDGSPERSPNDGRTFGRSSQPPTRPDLSTSRGRSNSATNDRTPAAAEPPPPRCPEHEDRPSSDPCGRCADARRSRERWDLADSERRRNAPKCRSHRGQPADNCALCRSEALEAQ